MQQLSQPERIRKILSDLESLRAHLLELSDDIWLNIDHNDQQALEQGYEFKRAYNEKLLAFNKVAAELSELVQRFTAIQIEPDSGEQLAQHNQQERERIVRELDRSQPHSLDEDFTYKRPYGYRLRETAHHDLVTWKQLYQSVCRQLAGYDLDRFRSLPRHPDFISNQGNPAFSQEQSRLREPLEITAGIYAESNLSANDIRNNIKKLLTIYGIDRHEIRIYLREDRGATA